MLSLFVRENRLQGVEIVAACELLKGFAQLSPAQVPLQHLLERLRQFHYRHAAENLPADRLVPTETSTDKNMITFLTLDLHAQQPDITHVMLGAGVRTAGQVDIEGRIEREFFLEIIRQGQRMPFRIGL